jgi:hypothetical protein
VVHPPSSCGFWEQADARAATRVVASAPPPGAGMARGVPVGGGPLHRVTDCRPGLEAPPLPRPRSPAFPPRRNQVQVRRILRREDELPAGMRQGAHPDIGGPMGTQMSHHGRESCDGGSNPGLHRRPKVDIVGGGASRLGHRQRLAISRLAGPEELPFAPPSVIALLGGPPGRFSALAGEHGWGWGVDLIRRHQLPSRNALGTLRPQLIAAHYDTAWRRRGRERRDAPLLSAKAGAPRAPNQVSCGRQRQPSASNSSSMRVRVIHMPWPSFR